MRRTSDSVREGARLWKRLFGGAGGARRHRARDELTRRLCQRNQGMGADGVEFLTWNGDRQGKIRLHNADGSIAEISGNGTRCAAAWIAYETKSGPGDEIVLETDAGRRICRIDACIGPDFRITSSMGVPEVHAGNLQLAGGARIEGAVVSTGNPHFVIFVDRPEFASRAAWEGDRRRELQPPAVSPSDECGIRAHDGT